MAEAVHVRLNSSTACCVDLFLHPISLWRSNYFLLWPTTSCTISTLSILVFFFFFVSVPCTLNCSNFEKSRGKFHCVTELPDEVCPRLIFVFGVTVCFDVRMICELTFLSSSMWSQWSSDTAPATFSPSSTSPTLAEQNNSQRLQPMQQLRLTASVRRTRAVLP